MSDEWTTTGEDLLRGILAELKGLRSDIRATLPKQALVAAPDSDLDSTYGDPVIKFDPKFWKGDPCVGKHYSQCPSEYLDMVAKDLTWKIENQADKLTAKGKPYLPYWRKDCARAIGWSKRNKNVAYAIPANKGVLAQEPTSVTGGFDHTGKRMERSQPPEQTSFVGPDIEDDQVPF